MCFIWNYSPSFVLFETWFSFKVKLKYKMFLFNNTYSLDYNMQTIFRPLVDLVLICTSRNKTLLLLNYSALVTILNFIQYTSVVGLEWRKDYTNLDANNVLEIKSLKVINGWKNFTLWIWLIHIDMKNPKHLY